MAKGRTVVELIWPNDDLTLPTGTEAARVINGVTVALTGFAGGAKSRTASVLVGQGGARATGTLTFSGASGTVGGSINGVAITVTAAGGDTNTAALWVAAVNASVNPLVAGVVTASNVAGVATVQTVQYGATGNAVTLTATGTGVTASGARLTGGTSATLRTLVR